MITKRIKALSLGMALALANTTVVVAADSSYRPDYQVDKKPSAGAMFIDATLVRPLMITTTLVGSALFVVSLPFSALGGNVGDAADNLVVEPARSAFKRPLGEF